MTRLSCACFALLSLASFAETFSVGAVNCGAFHYGSADVPASAYADEWKRLAEENPADVFLYGDVGRGKDLPGPVACKGLDIRAAAKRTPESVEIVDLPRTIEVEGEVRGTPRYRALRLTFPFAGGKLAVYGVHLVAEGHIRGPKPKKGEPSCSQRLRREQFRALIADAKRFDFAIIGGDFNAQRPDEYDVFAAAGFRLGNCSARFGTKATLRKIPADNVVISSGLEFEDFKVLDGYRLNTDHFPVLARVRTASGSGGDLPSVADYLKLPRAERVRLFADEAFRKAMFAADYPDGEGLLSRWIRVEKIPNLRDVGGFANRDGRMLRRGVFYRSAGWNDCARCPKDKPESDWTVGKTRLTERGREQAKALGIRTDLDLRSAGECWGMTASPLGPDVKWVNVSFGHYDEFKKRPKFKKAVKDVFATISEKENVPLVFHCIGGADRTGCLAFMIQGICGVDEETLVKDWELTGCYTARMNFTHEKAIDRFLSMLADYPGEDVGVRIRAFLLDCGVTSAQIEAVRSMLIGDAEDFGGAKWMWPRELGAVTNTTVEFRRTFTADRETPVDLAIAADTVYAVELNGRFVHSGRFPDVPPQRYYDVLPLGKVSKGTNELRISLYVQGIDSFQTLPGDPGLMFALRGEGVRERSGTDVEWRVSTRDRREGVPRVTSQLGFSFEYDASSPEAEWRRIESGDTARGSDAFRLERRPVPRVEILPEIPVTVVGQGRLDGSPVPAEVSPGMDATRMKEVSAADFFMGDGKGVRSACFRDGFYVLVDLGREEAGFLSLDVDTDAGAVIDIGHAEHMENGRIATHIGPRNFAGRYRTREGRQRYLRWARRMAGRYIQLHVRGVRTHFALHGVSVRPAVFPVTERPVPEGFTGLRRRIWETSVRTLRLCMHEHYEDCPWREQALYGNDARNQMLCGYFAFGPDNRMPELALTVHSRGLDDRAWLEMCMPAKIRITIPSFTLCWVLSVGDNLKYRGDVAFTRSLMPTVKRILDARLAEMRGDLLPCPQGDRYWQFYEWADDLAGGFNGMKAKDSGTVRFESPLNLFLVLALESAAVCAEATGDGASSARWRTAAERIRAAVRERFWNAAGGYMETRLGASLRPAELVQSLALLADAVPVEARPAIIRKLMEPSDWTPITLSQTLYKYEALIAAGGEAASAAVRSMETEWKRMLDAGATSFWEMREGWRAFDNAGSLCHGWSAVPVYIYGAYPELFR